MRGLNVCMAYTIHFALERSISERCLSNPKMSHTMERVPLGFLRELFRAFQQAPSRPLDWYDSTVQTPRDDSQQVLKLPVGSCARDPQPEANGLPWSAADVHPNKTRILVGQMTEPSYRFPSRIVRFGGLQITLKQNRTLPQSLFYSLVSPLPLVGNDRRSPSRRSRRTIPYFLPPTDMTVQFISFQFKSRGSIYYYSPCSRC